MINIEISILSHPRAFGCPPLFSYFKEGVKSYLINLCSSESENNRAEGRLLYQLDLYFFDKVLK